MMIWILTSFQLLVITDIINLNIEVNIIAYVVSHFSAGKRLSKNVLGCFLNTE